MWVITNHDTKHLWSVEKNKIFLINCKCLTEHCISKLILQMVTLVSCPHSPTQLTKTLLSHKHLILRANNKSTYYNMRSQNKMKNHEGLMMPHKRAQIWEADTHLVSELSVCVSSFSAFAGGPTDLALKAVFRLLLGGYTGAHRTHGVRAETG